MSTKLKMTKDAVVRIAEQLLQQNAVARPHGLRFPLESVAPDPDQPHQWIVVFGAETDHSFFANGPVILVDDRSGEAQFFETL